MLPESITFKINYKTNRNNLLVSPQSTASLCIRAASGPRRFDCSTSTPLTSPPSPAWSTGKAACTWAWSAAPWQSTPDHRQVSHCLFTHSNRRHHGRCQSEWLRQRSVQLSTPFRNFQPQLSALISCTSVTPPPLPAPSPPNWAKCSFSKASVFNEQHWNDRVTFAV